MKPYLVLAICLLLGACKSTPKSVGQNSLDTSQPTPEQVSKGSVARNDTIKRTSNFWVDLYGIRRHPESDSIDGKPVSYFLNNPKVASVAKRFYNGSFRPTDDDTTEYLLSLATTPDSLIRPFYRWCLNETIKVADGGLAERRTTVSNHPARSLMDLKEDREDVSVMQPTFTNQLVLLYKMLILLYSKPRL